MAATVLAVSGVVCLYPRNLSSSPKSVHTPMKRCTRAASHLYILRHWNLLGQALAKDHSVHHWGSRLACTSTLFLDPKTFNAFQCKWNVSSQNCWIFVNQHTPLDVRLLSQKSDKKPSCITWFISTTTTQSYIPLDTPVEDTNPTAGWPLLGDVVVQRHDGYLGSRGIHVRKAYQNGWVSLMGVDDPQSLETSGSILPRWSLIFWSKGVLVTSETIYTAFNMTCYYPIWL